MGCPVPGCWGVLCQAVLRLFSLTHKPLLPWAVGRSHSKTVAWGSWEGSGWSLSGSSICGALHAKLTPGSQLRFPECSVPVGKLSHCPPRGSPSLGLMEGPCCQMQTMFLPLVMPCRDWEPSALWCQVIPKRRPSALPGPLPSLCLSITPKGASGGSSEGTDFSSGG